METLKTTSFGLSSKMETGMEDSFPCAPGQVPLWQDKGLQIICLCSLVLLIFISEAKNCIAYSA